MKDPLKKLEPAWSKRGSSGTNLFLREIGIGSKSMGAELAEGFSRMSSSSRVVGLRKYRNIVGLRNSRKSMLLRKRSWFSLKRTSWQLASRRTGGSGFNIDKSPKRASRKNSARRPETRRKSLGDADLSNLPIDNGFSWINGYRGYLQWRSSPGRNFLRELEKFSHHPICKRDKYIQFCIQFFSKYSE